MIQEVVYIVADNGDNAGAHEGVQGDVQVFLVDAAELLQRDSAYNDSTAANHSSKLLKREVKISWCQIENKFCNVGVMDFVFYVDLCEFGPIEVDVELLSEWMFEWNRP